MFRGVACRLMTVRVEDASGVFHFSGVWQYHPPHDSPRGRYDAWSATAPVLIEPDLRRGELAVLPIRLPGLTLDFGLISLKNLMLSPAAKQCLDLVRQIEAQLSIRNRTLIHELLP